jgi:hypothetical protein
MEPVRQNCRFFLLIQGDGWIQQLIYPRLSFWRRHPLPRYICGFSPQNPPPCQHLSLLRLPINHVQRGEKSAYCLMLHWSHVISLGDPRYDNESCDSGENCIDLTQNQNMAHCFGIIFRDDASQIIIHDHLILNKRAETCSEILFKHWGNRGLLVSGEATMVVTLATVHCDWLQKTALFGCRM